MTCEMDPGRRPLVDEFEVDVGAPAFGTVAALIATACCAVSLAILPAVFALQGPGAEPRWVAYAVGSLAVVLAIAKLSAMAWGAGSSLWSWHRASVAAAYAD